MCKRTKKILFACTFAMQMLVYICASNLAINRVINGKGRGTSLRDIYKVPHKELMKLRPGDVFLDSATGDIYCYDYHRQIFYPVGNAGIHNHKIAQENEVKSKAILKSYKYIPRQTDTSDQVYIGQSNEDKFRVFKQYIQHWLTKELEFKDHLVSSHNSWDVHPFNPISKESIYTVLAESSRGPQILLHLNAVGVQFHVLPKYSASETVLRNFVVYMMNKFQNETVRGDLPLKDVNKEWIGVRPGGKTNFLEMKSNTLNLLDSNLKTIVPRHSGFAFSLRSGEPLTVQNNATTSEAIRVRTTDSVKRFYHQVDGPTSFYSDSVHLFTKTRPNNQGTQNRKKPDATESEHNLKPARPEQDLMDSTQQTWKSKKEIRSFLHPTYSVEDMPRSATILQGSNSTHSKVDLYSSDKPVIKVSVSSKPYCRYNKEFRKYDTNSYKKIQNLFDNIGDTIRSGTPYIGSDKLGRLKYTDNKKNWVSCKDFQRVFSPQLRSDGFKAVEEPMSMNYFNLRKQKDNRLMRSMKTTS